MRYTLKFVHKLSPKSINLLVEPVKKKKKKLLFQYFQWSYLNIVEIFVFIFVNFLFGYIQKY